jgi:Family of unknown function (DUF5906)
MKGLERDGHGFGMLGREYPAIDIDVTLPLIADVCAEEAGAAFGYAPVRRRGTSKCLLMYRMGNETLRKRLLVFTAPNGTEQAVELLATGQQYVIDGVHPDGQPYTWSEQPNPWNLNTITAAQWDTYCEALGKRLIAIGCTITKDGRGGATSTAGVKPSPESLLAPNPEVDPIAAMLYWKERHGDEHIPHDKFVDLCASFHGAAGNHADELFEQFRECLPGERATEENTDKTFHSFDAGVRLGWSKLCQITGFIPPDTFAEEPAPESMDAPDPRKVARDAAVSRYVYVSALDRVWDKDNTAILTASQFNAHNVVLGRHGAKGEKSAYSTFLNAPGRRTVDTLTYRPGAGHFYIEERDGMELECANTWRKGVDAVRGVIPHVWLKHGRWLLGTSQFALLCQWLAFVVQNPGVKLGWTPVIVGPQGVGKDAFFAPVRHALGAHNVACVDFGRLFDKFNADWAQKQLIIANEAKTSDHRRAQDTYNQLKTLFSSLPPTRKIEQKNVPIWNAPNIQVGVVLSNHSDAIALEPDDRRFGVFQCEPTKRPDNHEEFFAPYFEWCPRDDAPGADAAARRKRAGAEVMGYLLDLDISGFKPETAPDTPAKRAMIRAHRPDNAETWVADEFDEEGILHGRDVIAFDEFQGLLRQAEHALSTKALSQLLRKHGFAKREPKIRVGGPGGPEKSLWLKDYGPDSFLAQMAPTKLAERYSKQSAETQAALVGMLKAEGWQ